MWRSILLTLFIIQLGLSRRSRPSSESAPTEDDGSERTAKLLNLFQIVRFRNGACTGNAGRNGTCYTSEECTAKSGTNSGSCASGFGVCCTFSLGCGGTTRENCTYLDSGSVGAGTCNYRVCPCGSNICQLRLDFDTFIITGPSTATESVAKTFAGAPVIRPTKGVSVAQATQCLTDTFSVTSPGGIAPSSICGLNTGQHMYVDASEACNDLSFQLGANGIGTAVANRAWSIKVTQLSCDSCLLAPQGCTQYFYGATTDVVQTYNFDGGIHLANQNQNICVRRERGNCKICWSATQNTDFQLSGTSALGAPLTSLSVCCGYGTTGSFTLGYDCVSIPGAKTVASEKANAPSRICGRSGGLATTFPAVPVTVCSRRTPFSIRFLSDMYEFTGDPAKEANLNDKGFRLSFIQSSQGC